MPRTEAFMNNLARVLAMTLLPGLAIEADTPDWAYPGTPKPVPLDNVVQKQMPGSAKKYTQAQIDDGFNPPDWFPEEHPPMPEIVSAGKKPARACALDRKSTRLNSSHQIISYAVFCLKKKNDVRMRRKGCRLFAANQRA